MRNVNYAHFRWFQDPTSEGCLEIDVADANFTSDFTFVGAIVGITCDEGYQVVQCLRVEEEGETHTASWRAWYPEYEQCSASKSKLSKIRMHMHLLLILYS